MSFQIFLLVGHLTNWTGHNLLTDNTLKKRTQDVLVTCLVIVSDHNVKLARHFQNLVRQCPMTDCYFQHWTKELSRLYYFCNNNNNTSNTDHDFKSSSVAKHVSQHGFNKPCIQDFLILGKGAVSFLMHVC